MVGKRKTMSSAGPYRSWKVKKRTGSYKGSNRLLLAYKKRLLSRNRPEIKTLDIQINGSNLISTPQFFLLNATRQGTGTFERIGTKATMKSIQFRFNCEPIGATTQHFASVVRILLVYDKSPNKVILTFADLIRNQFGDGTTSSPWDGMKNIDNSDRFKILVDTEMYLPPFTSNLINSGPGDTNLLWTHYQKLNLPVQYTGSSSPPTISEITTGALYLIFVGQDGTCNYTMNGPARLRFYDN